MKLSDKDMEYYLEFPIGEWSTEKAAALREEALRARHEEWRRGQLIKRLIETMENVCPPPVWPSLMREYRDVIAIAKKEIAE